MGRNLLIVGASGLTGGEVLNYALNTTYYKKIYCLVRKSLGIKHPLLEEIVVDFDTIHDYNGPFSFNDVAICLGTTIGKAGSKEAFEKVDYKAIIDSADWAHNLGASNCAVISSVGANANTSNFYLHVKGKTENKLKNIGFDKLLIFRPGLLLGQRTEERAGEGIAQKLFGEWTQKVIIFGKYTSIKASQLAKSMVEALQNENTGAKVLHFNDMKKFF